MKGILVVEDHPLVRKAVADRVLKALGPSHVFQADSLQSAQAILEKETVALIVVDVMLGDGCGLTLTHGEGPPVVAFTLLDNAEVLARSPGKRLFAIVGKHEEPTRLDQVLRLALDQTPTGPAPGATLSQREQELLQRLLKGQRLVDIALENGVSHSTLQSYKNRMLNKLGIKTKHELFVLAASKGWLN